MSSLIAFGCCFLLGILLRLLFRLVTLLEKKTALIAVTVILDVGLAFFAVLGFAAIVFFICGGQVFSYCVGATIVGFCAMALLY